MLRPAFSARRSISRALPRLTRRSHTTETSPPSSRIARLEACLPRFLRHITTPLRAAPLSHITAFLILHELTAIVPLFGLAAAFHYTNWLPPFFGEGKWVNEGTERFGRWLRRRGYVTHEGAESREGGGTAARGVGKWWVRGEGGVRLAVELATAYAITKVLLPLRLLVSVWATPGFARWTVLPVTALMRRRMGWRNGGSGRGSPAAGTRAVGGGALPKDVVRGK